MTDDETSADTLEAIKARNTKVEADKAWETSWTRRIIIAVCTYLTVTLYLMFLGVQSPWLHALVPPVGYLLSTLTLPVCKRLWIEKCYNARSRKGNAG
jgi:hypothetical protein